MLGVMPTKAIALSQSHSLDEIVDVIFGRYARYNRAILVEPDYVVSVILDEQ